MFKGARQLLECLERLIQRPRRHEAPVLRGRPGPVPGVPLVCLKRADDSGALVDGLARYLKHAEPRRVPHAVHRETAAAPTASTDPADLIADLLLPIARDLAGGANTVNGRVRFSRFGLVHWLIRQDLGTDRLDPHAVLFQRLRERDLGWSKYTTLFSDEAPELLEAPVVRWARLARVVPPLWFRVRLGAGLPGVGREYRWLLRQPYLDPHSPGTVLGFAERLTLEQRRDEDPTDIARLLVLAFLTDLAHAYRRRFWRARGARRTSYPVVLLDGTGDATGHAQLLHLVSEVRSHPRHAFDPLVLVAAAQAFPPEATRGDGQHSAVVRWAASEAIDGYEAWCRRPDRPARTRTDWYLPVSIPSVEPKPAAGADDEQYAALAHAAGNARRFEVAAAPLWARPAVAPVIAAALAVAVLTGATAAGVPGVPQAFELLRPGPGGPAATAGPAVLPAGTPTPGSAPGPSGRPAKSQPALDPKKEGLPDCVSDETAGRFVELARDANGAVSCIGVAGQIGVFAESRAGISELDEKFAQINAEADRHHREAPSRRVITLVYVSSFLGNQLDDPVSQKLESVGFFSAAADYNRQRQGDSKPIVKVLFANGGDDLSLHSLLATQLEKARDKGRLTAVVGLDGSTVATQELIQELSVRRIPVVSATLTADGLGNGADSYFFVAAQNAEQARLIGQYAQEWSAERMRITKVVAPPREVAIVCPADGSNLWSKSLLARLREEFGNLGWNVAVYAYVPDDYDSAGGNTPEAIHEACGDDARFDEKNSEPDDVAKQLRGTPNRLVVFAGRWQPFNLFLKIRDFDLQVIAADDVSSAVARRYENPEIDNRTFSYVSLSYCGEGARAEKMPYDGYLKLGDLDGINARIDSHAPLALAAAQSVIDAAAAALKAGQEPTPEQVMAQLKIMSQDFGGLPGALDPEEALGDKDICRISVLQARADRHVQADPLMERRRSRLE
ncbi:ABC transporter substrate-binding protein [Kineosporia succinea]|uniref:ABC-type branched-subunit amino acid transport system substrate-binding protein n=1 Tax=Kineosporia succinea TaxID=84632 RepID=A0ABT9PBR9_9ACTN|nr:hypothetical protein [Kineosporia succinea]MDP9829844.1 hypothetical protein [Kineosporia succinea]